MRDSTLKNILVLGIVGLGGWFLYNKFKSSAPEVRGVVTLSPYTPIVPSSPSKTSEVVGYSSSALPLTPETKTSIKKGSSGTSSVFNVVTSKEPPKAPFIKEMEQIKSSEPVISKVSTLMGTIYQKMPLAFTPIYKVETALKNKALKTEESYIGGTTKAYLKAMGLE